MTNRHRSQALRSNTSLVLLGWFGFSVLVGRSESQELQFGTTLVQSAPVVDLPPELQLAGVWTFLTTTYGVQSRDGDHCVQQGHWAIVHDGNAYMTGYSFDKTNPRGRRFLISVSADSNDGLFVQSIDVEDDYTKRYGICEISKDGSHVKLAFCIPPDGSLGEKPTSFDPRRNATGFALIELKRLASAQSDSSVNAGTSAKAIAADEQSDARETSAQSVLKSKSTPRSP